MTPEAGASSRRRAGQVGLGLAGARGALGAGLPPAAKGALGAEGAGEGASSGGQGQGGSECAPPLRGVQRPVRPAQGLGSPAPPRGLFEADPPGMGCPLAPGARLSAGSARGR